MAKVKLIRGSGLQRKLSIDIDAERFNKRYQQELIQTGERVKLPGFRPGQVSGDVVEQRYGKEIRNQIVDELMRESLTDAIGEHNLRPAAAPAVNDWTDTNDGGVKFVAEFEVMPEIEFSDRKLAKLKLTHYREVVNDADVDTAIGRLLENNPDWQEVDEPAQHDYRLVCDFCGRVDGEIFPGGDADGYTFILGKGEAIPGFEKQILGMRAGGEKTFELDVPEEHSNEEIRGKRVQFEVKLIKVEQSAPAKISDEFAAGMTPPQEETPYNMETLRTKVSNHLQGELQEILQNRTRRDLLKTLGDAAKFSIPDVMVEERLQRRKDATNRDDTESDQQQPEQEQTEQEQTEQPQPELTRAERKADQQKEKQQRDEAVAELQSALLLSHIAQQHEVKVEAKEVRAEIERRVGLMGAQYEPEKLIEMFYQNEELLRGVESNVREDNTIALVLDKANTSVRNLGYDEALELFKDEAETKK